MQIQNKAYACYNTDVVTRLSSSSGAVFSVLASYVLAKSGVVYGVAMSDNCYFSEYICVNSSKDIKRLRGSKYLQANLGDTFKNVKVNLEAGKTVLFTGTACQVNGLKKFLSYTNIDQKNLICVDVICHGVPSPALWKKYAEYREEQQKGKLQLINFRCKNENRIDYNMKEILGNMCTGDDEWKKLYISKDKDPYMQMFLRNYCLRPSCYECLAKKEKGSDVTIGDFWGSEKIVPDMNDGRGISLVLIRNERGMKIWEKISEFLCVQEVSYESGIRYNSAEYKSVVRPTQRDTFFEDFKNMSFEELERKYVVPSNTTLKRKLKNRIKSIILPLIKNTEYGLEFVFRI